MRLQSFIPPHRASEVEPPPSGLPAKTEHRVGQLASLPATDVEAMSGTRPIDPGASAGRLTPAIAGALLGATLTVATGAPVPASAQVVEPPPPVATILDPRGSSRGDKLFDGTRIGEPGARVVRPAPDARIADPATVMTAGGRGAAEVRRIVTQRVEAPRTAEAVARALAEAYGPFTAANSAENRAAIIENLRWIAGTGVRYEHARAGSDETTTYTPNQTLSRASGVCRDTHTAAAAVLASLINARQENGRWVPGSPTGQEANVQVTNFATPNEHHAFLVYRDPGSRGWDALEYGRSYDLDAPTAADAARALPNHLPGYSTYRITGWSTRPVIASRHVVDAAAARAFFSYDPGVGEAGEVRVNGGAHGGLATAFLTDKLSVSGQLDIPSEGSGLDGGLKLNYHDPMPYASGTGHIRYGGGIYTQGFEATDTGRRAAADREPLRTYVLAFKYDQRYTSEAREIIGDRLRFRYGADVDMTVALPFGPEGAQLGNLYDYSNIDVGIDGALLGTEQLSPQLTLDWAVQARYEIDVLNLAQEVRTSEFGSFRAAGADALRADFAMALTHESEGGLVTRLEAGGTQWLASPLDPGVSPQGDHYAIFSLRPQNGQFDFGVLARGQTIDGDTVPADSLGIALRYAPSDNMSFGLTVDGVAPEGDFDRFGENVRVMGGLKMNF